jgi:diguanylate cyclase (GGDEF)-like protein/PAS domain S-box-containing protein
MEQQPPTAGSGPIAGRGPRTRAWPLGSRAWRRGRPLPLLLLAGYAAIFSVWVLVVPNSGLFNIVTNAGGLLGALAGGALAWATTLDPLLPPHLRRSWRWLSWSLTLFWLGDAAFLAQKVALAGGQVGSSPADALYLASYPLAVLALLTGSSRPLAASERAAFWLDTSIITLSAATLAWHVFVQPTLSGRRGAEELTAVGYVLCDAVLLLVVAIGVLGRGTPQRGLLLLGLAFLIRLVANSLYWVDVLLGPPGWAGQAAAIAYNVFWLAFAAAAWWQARETRLRRHQAAPAPPAHSALASWLPTAAAAVGYLVLAGSVVARLSLEFGFLVFAGVALTASVLARQVVAVREAAGASAARAARANEARFRSLVQNTSDIVLVVGSDGRIRYHTPSAERFLGSEGGRIVGTPLADLVRPDEREVLSRLLEEAVRRPGSTPSAEWRLRWSDGSWRWVEAQAKSVPDDPNLGGVILTLRSVHEHKQLEARLVHQAFHDPLTSLVNRMLLAERLAHALMRSRRAGEPVTVLFVDLDDFKNVNDSLGHATGDLILVELARRLLGCVRSGDTAARLGGDEFAVLLESGGVSAALQVAERVHEAVRRPFLAAGREIVLGASIGVASSASGVDSSGDLLRNADVAMYRAKQAGKSRVVVFEPSMQAAVRERLDLEEELRGALRRREMHLLYQPIVELASGRIVGVEGLLRWQHRSRGRLCPADFFPAAEAAGVMPALGRWSIVQACSAACTWPAGDPLIVCVNIAPGLLAAGDLVTEVVQAVAATGLPSERLVLELTEGAAVEDAPATFAALRALRALGVRIAIDDFGTGYSSLSYLRQIPADILKLDRVFVEGLAGDDREAHKLARGILDLARALGKLVIAEGIEHEAQAERLLELGCTLGQGFRYSTPVDLADLSALLHAGASGAWAAHRAPESSREKGRMDA